MKFFEAVPGELFSPLASPNRTLYADALDVLYTAYRENLKIREDTLYSMLRSRLEQQLADATFEGEDIDEEELRDISGRARFLIRKLCGKGWFEKERGDDFEEYITVPSYSSRLLELFHQLRDDRPARGFSYVFGTYSALKVADESESVYDKMAAIYSAYDNTSALINLLQMVYHNVKHYFQMQIDMQDVNQVLASHFNEFGQKVVEAYIRPLKIKDSVPKYRVPIQSVLRSWAEDDALLLAMANATLQDKRGDTVENCRSDLLRKIFWIDERYDNIEHDYLDEIDAQVRRYTRAATQKVENRKRMGKQRRIAFPDAVFAKRRGKRRHRHAAEPEPALVRARRAPIKPLCHRAEQRAEHREAPRRALQIKIRQQIHEKRQRHFPAACRKRQLRCKIRIQIAAVFRQNGRSKALGVRSDIHLFFIHMNFSLLISRVYSSNS